MNPINQNPEDSLNPFHESRLRITCQYIDKILVDMESVLDASHSKAAFPKYMDDISPEQRQTIRDYIAQIRVALTSILEAQKIEHEPPMIPASRSIHVNLGAIDIAIEELKPRHMRGYGEISERAAQELNTIVGELRGLVQRFDQFLTARSKVL